MMMNNFEQELANRSSHVEHIIEEYLPKPEGFQKTLIEAMNYTMKSGGKRIRPLLMQETYRLFGGEDKIIEPFMAAMEMIHTYSLVHDDLPALDNDEYRRGRKTAHMVFGEDQAILAGDALLNYAFQLGAAALITGPTNERLSRAMFVLASKPGIYGMIGGQAADVELTGRQITEDQLAFIHANKTGALIEASMMIGAILGGANEEEVRLIESIGADIGMAFQIEDDILDVTSTKEELGKPINSDERNGKVTYVTLKGLQQAKDDAHKISMRAINNLETLSNTNEFLRELILYLVRRQN